MESKIDDSDEHPSTLEPTLNQRGSMHELTKYSKIFIEQCKHYKKPVVDVGCAYGVSVIPALKNGATVVANDIDATHLDILIERTPQIYLKNLICLNAHFPHELNFHKNSISCVHLSLILSFLNGQEIRIGLKKINEWLHNDGELIIINYTPFIKLFEKFLPQYELNKKNRYAWPGYIADITKYISENQYCKNLPKSIQHFDIETLTNELIQHGFSIKKAEYYTNKNLPQCYKLNGREFVGIIAKKITTI